jgi:hypothetical protein
MDFVEEIVVQGVTAGLALGLLAVLLLLLPLAVPRFFVRRRRHFWCATARERVDVEFEERGLPGFRNAIAVLSCSRFEPPSAIACQRRCLSAAFRRQWPPALPVGGRPVGGAS